MKAEKKETRTQRSVSNLQNGLVNKFVLTFFPFLVKTIMIQKLGAEYLGLSSLFTSILQVLSLTELGVGNAIVYSMYQPMAERNRKEICRLLCIYRSFYRVTGIVILCIGLLLLPFLEYLIKGTYPEDINLQLLYLIYLGNTVLSYFLFAYKKSLFEASQQNSVESRINTFANLIMYAGQIVTLCFLQNYYVYILWMPFATVLMNVIRNILVSRAFPDYVPHGRLSRRKRQAVYKRVKALIGHKIGSVVITSADSIVISSFLGLETLAVYSNYYYIINALIGFMTVFYNSVMASVGNSLVTAPMEKNYRDFSLLSFINFWLVGWFSICLLCLYQPFIELWMGAGMMFPFHVVILFVIYFYAWLFRRIGLTYKDAAGMWSEDFWKPYAGTAVNLAANILLVNIIGVEGVILSTIIVMLGIYAPWETKVLFAGLFQRPAKEYLKVTVFCMAVTAATGAVTYGICSLIAMDGWGLLLVRGMICATVPNLLFAAAYGRMDLFRMSLKKAMSMECITAFRIRFSGEKNSAAEK